MEATRTFYRKNLSLLLAFFILVSVSFVLALLLAYNLTRKSIESDFNAKKIDVFEQTIKPYNDFFQNSIPEVSYYQGYLDSASANKYVQSLMGRYTFLDKVIFYDTEISSQAIADGFRLNNFSIGPKAVYQFGRKVPADSVVLFRKSKPNTLSLKTADEFNKMAIKFSGFVELVDTAKALSSNQLSTILYNINTNRITYFSAPRREELGVFKELMFGKRSRSPVYEKDMFTFYLDPAKLPVKQIHSEIYQQVRIVPLAYEELSEESAQLQTEIALPGAFSGYKIYFSATPAFLQKGIIYRFLPIAGLLLLIYGILAALAYFIYRNLQVNQQLFKLQYDFINNFTHEFKTPVSVIKVAGNNISNSKSLSDRERLNYGKILDEEADKLNDLMNKLLSFTQLENRAIRLNEEWIDLNEFCANCIATYQVNKPDFKIDYQLSGVHQFKTDPILLSSLFNNLMDNAYKYSEAGSRELNIHVFKEGNQVKFSFADRGIGIAKADLKHIFKKFYRIQNQYNQQGSVGLGLALCKELVKFMNGSIEVESQPTKGTTFTVTLPFQD
jgi:two-component system phosphate regulon sensor histidine kinase PhoR